MQTPDLLKSQVYKPLEILARDERLARAPRSSRPWAQPFDAQPFPTNAVNAPVYLRRKASGSCSESRTVLYRREDRSYAHKYTSRINSTPVQFVDADQPSM
jgi:hypothetical protein